MAGVFYREGDTESTFILSEFMFLTLILSLESMLKG